MDFSTFFVDRIVVHEVPRNTSSTTAADIVFSDVESPLSDDLRNFFKERTSRSLMKHGYDVERDPDQPSPVPDQIRTSLEQPAGLVAASREITKHLYESQRPVSNDGLLITFLGRVEGADCLGILKLEREDAIRVEEIRLDTGEMTFNVAHLHDLMLGKHTRLFKASIFALDGDGSIEGVVSDDQRGYHPTTEIATFFLSEFLGCRLRSAPDVSTKAFFEAAQGWIDGEVDDPEKKARYEIGLLQEMNRQAPNLVPNRFAEENLDVEDRQPFREALQAAEAPTTLFDKDLKLVASRIKRLSFRFAESELKLTGTAEDVDRFVTVNPPSSEAAPVEIHDRPDSIRGGG